MTGGNNNRVTPRVANLAARDSNRAAEWREKMRSMQIQDIPDESLIERTTEYWNDLSESPSFWSALAWLSVVAVFVAALIVIR